ncbi:unnamed protein product [Arctogadus glacialis]
MMCAPGDGAHIMHRAGLSTSGTQMGLSYPVSWDTVSSSPCASGPTHDSPTKSLACRHFDMMKLRVNVVG